MNSEAEKKKQQYKSIIKKIKISAVIGLLLIAIPLVFYFTNFSYGLSSSKADWGAFGDFFGGIIGTLVGILNLIVITYLTIRVIRIDEERNDNTIKEMARPYANIKHFIKSNSISITIENVGLGPLIITQLYYQDKKNNKFKNFASLSSYLVHYKFIPDNLFSSDDCSLGKKYALGRDQSVTLFKIYFDSEQVCDDKFAALESLKVVLNSITIFLEYEDIYNRTIEFTSEKIQFKPMYKSNKNAN